MKRMYQRLLVRLALVIIAAVLLLTVGTRALGLLLPFLLAYVASWSVEPAAKWLCDRCHLPRRLTAALILIAGYGALLAIVVWYIGLFTSELAQMVSSLQDIQNQTGELLQTLQQWILAPFDDDLQVRMAGLFQALTQTVLDSLPAFAETATKWATDVVRVVPMTLLGALVMIMATYLITADYEHISGKLHEIMQTPLLRPFLRILTMIRAVFGGYLLAAVVMSLAVSLINLAGFLLMKVEFAAIIAATMGVLDFLPYVGSGLVLVPWCIYCFAVGETGRALGLITIYAAVFVLRNVVGRRLLGARYQHNSFFLLICVFIGWKLGGIGGVILGQMFGMMLANVYRNGMLDRTLRDLRLAWNDVTERLRPRKEA